jgi:pyrroloquinoline-quinone synthase
MKEIFKQFDDYIQLHRYSKHPFVKLLAEPSVTKTHLKNWAIQKYHQTFLQNVTFSAIHTNSMCYEDIRQFQIQQLIVEETPISDGSDSHYNLMKNFALAMGATELEIQLSKVAEPVKKFVHYMASVCKDNHPTLGMLANYVNESQTPESANKMYATLKQRFGLDEHALEWFSVHGEADIEHADSAKTLILKHAGDCPNFVEKAWDIVKQGTEQWTNLQNYYADILR